MTASEYWHNSLMSLAGYYAEEYKKDGKNWVRCFRRFNSVRMACMSIVARGGKVEAPDFSEFANRQEIELSEEEEKRILSGGATREELIKQWRQTLNDTLRIIYFLTN